MAGTAIVPRRSARLCDSMTTDSCLADLSTFTASCMFRQFHIADIIGRFGLRKIIAYTYLFSGGPIGGFLSHRGTPSLHPLKEVVLL